MIRGVIGIGSTEIGTAIAISGDTLKSTKTKTNGSMQYYSEKEKFGFEVAHGYSNRSVFCSHFSCTGSSCQCYSIVEEYCFDSSLTLDKIKEKTTDLTSPFLFMFVEAKELLIISCFNQGETVAVRKGPGFYHIRDYLTYQTVDDQSEVCIGITSWLDAESKDGVKAVADISKYFNGLNHTDGDTIYLLQNDNNFLKPVFDMAKIVIPKLLFKPKRGKTTAYNFFSKDYHKEVKLDKADTDTYNQKNVKIAANWFIMTVDEKRPSTALAGNDKIRYNEEMKNLQKSNPSNSRSTSAYNIFAHQENVFLKNFGCNDLMGQHCGKRWKEMSENEKSIYLDLHEAINSGKILGSALNAKG